MNYHSVTDLNKELEAAIINQQQYHDDMLLSRKFYLESAFYQRKAGEAPMRAELKTNLLKVFADKNIHYNSPFPTIKVPTTGGDEQSRLAASIREKILYAVHRKSGTALLNRRWAFDETIFSVSIAETGFDLKNRCAFVRRYDPRRVFWQLSNDNEKRVIAFWAVYAVTKEEAINTYGVTPQFDYLGGLRLRDKLFTAIDGKEWFTMAIRWDDKVKATWIGDKMVGQPFEHQLGGLPIDICMPFEDGDETGQGAFYLNPLVPLQAELNYVLKQRANIVQRMANPLVWGRGMQQLQMDDMKAKLGQQGGGFVGLKKDGELGLLQLQETKLLDNHANDIMSHMMKISGFSSAAFGESVGANTSGDALGMYFTPTQRLIENQNVAKTAFLESINSKILRCYDRFGKIGEVFNISGYSPQGTLLAMTEGSSPKYSGGGFDVKFDRTVIDGNYNNVVIPKPITPKNEIEEKRFWLDAANQAQVSKTTMYENIGVQSPEDELELLKQERLEPSLNPEGTSAILGAMNPAGAPALPPGMPTPMPKPELTPAAAGA